MDNIIKKIKINNIIKIALVVVLAFFLINFLRKNFAPKGIVLPKKKEKFWNLGFKLPWMAPKVAQPPPMPKLPIPFSPPVPAFPPWMGGGCPPSHPVKKGGMCYKN